jgi:transposase
VHFKIKNINGYKYLYLIQNKRIKGEVKQAKQICVGSPQKVYDLLTKKKELKVASYSFGKPAALLKASADVGLTESLNNRINRKNMDGLTPAQYLLTIIIGRAEHVLSRNKLNDYFRDSILSFYWKPQHKLNSQNFLNYMEKLDEDTIKKVEMDVASKLVELGYLPTKLIFDTTNYYTHIEHGEELPKKSNSKEKRFDKNLIGLGMTVSDANLPFNSFTYPANQHDAKVFSEIIDEICNRLKEINIPTSDITMVIDRGMLSEDNIKGVLENMHIVGSLPYSMVKDLYSIPLSEYEIEWKNNSKNTIKAHRMHGDHYGLDFTLVIKYNEKTARKQKREWERNKKKIFEAVEKISKGLNRKGRGRKMTAKGATNRIVDSIHKQYRGLFDYSVVKANGHLELNFDLLETEEKIYLASLGKTVIFTDDDSTPTKEIVETYASRNVIEEDYKWLKDKLLIPLKPMYVWKDSKIRAHVFLCVMGLLLYNYIKLKVNIPGLSLPGLSQELDRIRLSIVMDEIDHMDYVVEEMNRDTADLFNRLDITDLIPA